MNGLFLLPGAYLLGSVSFSYLMVRALQGVDVREVGSGNAGTTNVLRTAGVLPALGTLVFDVGKGTLAVWAARLLEVSGPLTGSVAVAAVAGHVFPIFHRFRGGKGVATAVGALGLLAPLPTALGVLIFLVVVLLTRYVSLGSLVSAGSLPFLEYLCAHQDWTPGVPPWLLVSTATIAGLILVRHSENIARLRSGREPKLGRPRLVEAAKAEETR